MAKAVCISDTHSYHRRLEIPPADFLIHAGDISWRGEPKILYDFTNWLEEQTQVKHKIIVPGNHELALEDEPNLVKMIFDREQVHEAGIHYLNVSGIELEGIKFWGSGYTPWFHDWAWNFPERDCMRDFQFAKDHWNLIPYDTNVLITHGPPRGILDKCLRDERVGCPVLYKRVGELKQLKAHIWGHIHEAYGELIYDGIHCVNAAICTLEYKPTNKPIVITI